WDLLEDPLVKEFGNVDGRGLQEGGARPAARGSLPAGCTSSLRCCSPLEPVDHVAGVRFEEEFELAAKARDALTQAGRFFDFSELLDFRFEQAEGGTRAEIEIAGGFKECFAIRERLAAIAGHGQCRKKHACAV